LLCASAPDNNSNTTYPILSQALNPIEQAFAKFKAALRKAAQRTREALADHRPNPRPLPAAGMPKLL
jgi:transposase